MKAIKKRISLTLYFSLSLFVMYLITFAITAALMSFSLLFGWINESTCEKPIIIMLITLVSCIIVGTIISTVASKRMLSSVRLFMDAMNQLASGDFSARLNITHPPEYELLSENFNHMAEELAGIEVLRTDFINNFSHEFKTPIVSIKGFAEILKDDSLTKEEREEYLDIVIEESTRLSNLATNVLTLSKVEAQSILSDQQLFNIGEQIRQCVLLLETKLEKKQLILNADIQDYHYFGNKEMLNQVWLNILDNAIKFTSQNGIIDISMKKVSNSIVITISDTGVGIAAEAIPKIFDKFYQEDTSHATMGNGLGLSIVYKIIHLHKGSIVCESTLSRGSSFTIELPNII